MEMRIDLSHHFVAFIDVLGFSAMVDSDCTSPSGTEKYIDKLFEIHNEILSIKDIHPGLDVVQFSDSIVISIPFNKDMFSKIIDIVLDLQVRLFLRDVLCRGGIAYGKHFSSAGFLFSAGLIEAYRLESMEAVNPRVVISRELIDLLFPDNKIPNNITIVMESDGVFFIDYMSRVLPDVSWAVIEKMLPLMKAKNRSVSAKIRWIVEYYNFTFPSEIINTSSRFCKL